jgi:hypothetical protein
MNDNEFRCNCVEMTRAIKDEIDAEFATVNELFEYLVSCRKTNDVPNPKSPI